jgi:glycosyltransferase involved in cell wall biosynthesis
MTAPRVSVVTTVYDRVACLDRCLRAMAHSTFPDWEQVVVADAPAPEIRLEIDRIVHAQAERTHVRLMVLPERRNDWGMSPAYVGLKHALGDYVCFLSDDNAYLPGHLGPLVNALDADPALAFAYSGCQYDGRFILNESPPRGSRIDLGQPLFRRDVLLEVFPTGFPYREFAWDWRVIAAVMEGRSWRHHKAPTFLFRFAKYPALMRSLA